MKGTKLYSIFFNKCPRCHEGAFFKSSNPFSLKEFDKMNDSCSVCHESFVRETGFYYGAMYVSYALTVGLGLAVFFINSVLLGNDMVYSLLIFVGLALILWTWLFRTARLTWINFFVKYRKPEYKTENSQS